jgi:adsorption protein B
VTAEELSLALRKTQNTKQTVGNYLLEQGIITEEQLLAALAHIKHVQYLEVSNPEDFVLPELGTHFKREQLEELLVVPLLQTDTGFVLAFSDSSPYNAQTILREQYGITVNAVLATQEKIELALHAMYDHPPTPTRYNYILEQYGAGKINYEQTIIAINYLQATGWTEEEVLKRMGLNPQNQRERSKQLEQVDVIFDELINATIETLRT